MFFRACLFVVLLFLLTPSSSFADSNCILRGHILDQQNTPINKAVVKLYSRNGQIQIQTISQQDAVYVFPSVAPGDYLMIVSADGFPDVVRNIKIISDVEMVDIKLALETIQDEVIVTSTGTPLSITENARSTKTISAKEIDQRNEFLVSESLRTTPGLRVNQRGGPGAFTSLRFRGLRTEDTSVLVDGVRVRDSSGFRGDFTSVFSDLVVSNLDKIEVVKGSSGPLYGTSATGGVINLVSPVRIGNINGNFSFEGGGLGQLREKFNIAGSAGSKFGYSLGVTRTDVNSGIDGNDVFRNTAFGSHLVYKFAPNISFSTSFNYSDSPRVDFNSSPFPIGPIGNEFGYEKGTGQVVSFVTDLDDPDARRRSKFLNNLISLNHQVNQLWSYSVFYQYTKAGRDFSDGPLQNQILAKLGVPNFSFEVSKFNGANHLFGTKQVLQLKHNNLVTVGFEHERESFNQDFVASIFGITSRPTTDRQSSTAFFIADQLSLLNRKLQFTLGFRAQRFDINNPKSISEIKNLDAPSSYTGDASISYYIEHTQTKVRTHIGNSFRAPSLSERFSSVVINSGLMRVGNPLIRPERALSFDIGFDQSFAKGKVLFEGTYFYTRQQENIISTALFKQINARGGLSRGTEIEATVLPIRNLSFTVGYTYTQSDFIPPFSILRANNTFAPASISRRQHGIPAHQFSIGCNYAISRWNINLDFTGISKYDEVLFSPNTSQQVLFTFDGYKKTDLGVSYTIPIADRLSLRFYTTVNNVFKNRSFEDGFRIPSIVAQGGVRLQF